MSKPRARLSCRHCGYVSPRPLGRCPTCGEWGTFVEEVAAGGGPTRARPIDAVSQDEAPRLPCGLGEVDRVLGGGLVAGSLVLLGGDPGVGKSTLLLQSLDGLARGQGRPVLYASGEESAQQVALRASRLGVRSPRLMLLAETRLEAILDEARRLCPAVLAIDSIQTLLCEEATAAPGSVSQVREAASRLLTFAKEAGTAVWIVGHVTKDGGLAGPRTLEHVVDAVLHFEGGQLHRLLRCSKNRFGSTSEVGVLEMGPDGLREVANPSALFLAERPVGVPGSAVIASSEGSRPLLVEVQALVAASAGLPRRATLGIDPQRVALLLAVLERRAGIDALGLDVFVNVAGGVRIDEPAADLGVIAAIASAAGRRPVEAHTLCFGEVGLAGEIRAVTRPEARLAEAAKLGFRRCVLPASSLARLPSDPGIEVIGVRDIRAALSSLLS